MIPDTSKPNLKVNSESMSEEEGVGRGDLEGDNPPPNMRDKFIKSPPGVVSGPG